MSSTNQAHLLDYIDGMAKAISALKHIYNNAPRSDVELRRRVDAEIRLLTSARNLIDSVDIPESHRELLSAAALLAQ
jgi:hypothetical protein